MAYREIELGPVGSSLVTSWTAIKAAAAAAAATAATATATAFQARPLIGHHLLNQSRLL